MRGFKLTEGKDLDKKEVISKLCKISTTIADEIFDGNTAHDCFCGMNPLAANEQAEWFFAFHFDEKIIQYIENAVARAIETDKIFKERVNERPED